MHRLVKEPDDETTLYVGGENWPLPIPIVERNGSWYFDCSLGRREVLYRRIGENEMNTIDALRGAFDAENQYYTNSAEVGTNAVEEYAQHLTCSQGQHDGLFSPASGAITTAMPSVPISLRPATIFRIASHSMATSSAFSRRKVLARTAARAIILSMEK
jgi:hypothetical protein